MVVLARIPTWFSEKKVPKEVLWALLVFILGIAVSSQAYYSAPHTFLWSEHQWATMKSTVLFVASGPFIFIATKYLFETTKFVSVDDQPDYIVFGLFGNIRAQLLWGHFTLFRKPSTCGNITDPFLNQPNDFINPKTLGHTKIRISPWSDIFCDSNYFTG